MVKSLITSRFIVDTFFEYFQNLPSEEQVRVIGPFVAHHINDGYKTKCLRFNAVDDNAALFDVLNANANTITYVQNITGKTNVICEDSVHNLYGFDNIVDIWRKGGARFIEIDRLASAIFNGRFEHVEFREWLKIKLEVAFGEMCANFTVPVGFLDTEAVKNSFINRYSKLIEDCTFEVTEKLLFNSRFKEGDVEDTLADILSDKLLHRAQGIITDGMTFKDQDELEKVDGFIDETYSYPELLRIVVDEDKVFLSAMRDRVRAYFKLNEPKTYTFYELLGEFKGEAIRFQLADEQGEDYVTYSLGYSIMFGKSRAVILSNKSYVADTADAVDEFDEELFYDLFGISGKHKFIII